jgi:hypothetical protein
MNKPKQISEETLTKPASSSSSSASSSDCIYRGGSIDVPAVPQKWFGSADSDTDYTILHLPSKMLRVSSF